MLSILWRMTFIDVNKSSMPKDWLKCFILKWWWHFVNKSSENLTIELNFKPIKPHKVIGFGPWNIIYIHCSTKTTYIHCIFIWFLWLYLLATQTIQRIDCRAFNYEILIFFAIFQKSSSKKWIALFCFHGVIYDIRTFVTHFLLWNIVPNNFIGVPVSTFSKYKYTFGNISYIF